MIKTVREVKSAGTAHAIQNIINGSCDKSKRTQGLDKVLSHVRS